MSFNRNLLIRGGADFSGIQREMAKVQGTLSNFQTNVSKVMKGIGFTLAGLGIGKLVKDSINAASELEGAMLGLSSILEGQGRSFGKANKFINEYINDGLVPLADAVTAYKNLAARGYNDEQIKQVMERLKDSAAFGRQAGLQLGEAVKTATEGLKNENSVLVDNAGVTKNVAKMWDEYAKSIGKNRNQLTDQEKIQAEVNGIMRETQWQIGDAVKYTNTYAGRVAALSKTLRDVKVNLGNAFMPIANIVLPLLQTLANGLARVTSIFAQFTQALFGKAKTQTKQAQAQSIAVGGQAESVEELGNATEKAGKQAKGALAGFDEINSLSDSSDSGGSSGSGGSGGIDAGIEDAGMVPIDFETNAPEISEKVQAMAEMVKSAINSIGEFVTRNKEIIIAATAGIITALLVFETLTFLTTLPAIFTALGASLSVLLSPIGLVSIAIGSLVGLFVYLYQTNEDFKSQVNAVWSEIAKTMNGFVNNTLKPIFSYITKDFLAPLGKAFKDYILPVLADLFVGIGQILNDILKLLQSTVDNVWRIIKPALELLKTIITDTLEIIKKLWDKYGQDLINNVREFIQGLEETFQLIWDNIIHPIIEPALDMLTWLWEEHLKDLVEQVGEFIMKCVNGAMELYNGFIKPIIDWMVEEFGPAISNAVAFIVDVFGTMLAGISDILKGLFKALGGVVDFIVGVFTGNWKKAWEGVKNIFKGVFDSLYGLVKVPLNLIIDAINFVIRGLNKISIDIPDWVSKITGISGTWGFNINEIPKLARGGIVDSPTVAMIGEAGKEMVVPLENTSFVDKLAGALGTAVMSAMQFSNGNSQSSDNRDIILQIDGTTFARVINPYTNRENERLGNTMIIKSV